ncbi:hypothetical protein JCM10207_006091 [Rhodosporidiobolus poonsookiae]
MRGDDADRLPFARASPPASRIASTRPTHLSKPSTAQRGALPASASESALANPPKRPSPASLPPKPKKGVKPFLLRGVSGGSTGGTATTQEGGVGSGAAPREEASGMKRSKTVGGFAPEAATDPGKAARPKATTVTSTRASSQSRERPASQRYSTFRPLSLAGPSVRPLSAASARPGTSSRPPLKHLASPSRAPSAGEPLHPASSTSSSSASRLEAVERRKLEMKRQTLLQRQKQRSSMPVAAWPDALDEPEERGEGGMQRSKGWLSRLAGGEVQEEEETENVPPSRAEAAAAAEGSSAARALHLVQDRPPTPPFCTSSSPNPPLSPVKRALDSDAARTEVPCTPPPVGLRAPQRQGQAGGKKAYGGLGVVQGKPSRDKLVVLPTETAKDERVPERMKHEEGYSSLQELLERHGYRETRVVTPQTKLRKPSSDRLSPSRSASPAASSSPKPASTSLAVPAPTLKERSSLLSLRGLFSFFGSSGETTDAAEPAAVDPLPKTASPSGSNNTLRNQQRHRTPQDLQEWVSGVAMAYSSSQDSGASGPLASASAATPALDPSSDYGSPVSGRSYSSSLSGSSPPTPTAHLRVAPSSLAVSKPPLRHVVSESALGTSRLEGGYQSFTGLGIAVPSSFLDSSPSPPSSTPPSPARGPSVRITPPGGHRYSSWLAPTAFLRERTSQIFGFGASADGSVPAGAVDAAVGKNAVERARVREESSGGSGGSGCEGAGGKGRLPPKGRGKQGPKLLRKAVSCAGLVRPVTTAACVGTRSSAESLNLGVETESVVSGGVEDMLGRRWAR